MSPLHYRTISQSNLELSKLKDLYVGSLYKREEEKKEENVINVVKSENDSLLDSPTHHTRHVITRKEKRLK